MEQRGFGRFSVAVLALAVVAGVLAGGWLADVAGARVGGVLHEQRAPSGPPLTSAAGAPVGEAEVVGADASASVPSSAGDPLVANGLGSPLCRVGSFAGELSAASARNCRSSGFEAAPAPTGNYAFDVHIDTGVFGLGSGAVSAAVQDLFITPVWLGLVWVVHALIVALEWCYALDLLDSPAMGGVARGLREAQAAFTAPWLVLALALASILAVIHGLVRRRVAETLGQALVMLAMMAGGLWAIADPAGTVGALGGWANPRRAWDARRGRAGHAGSSGGHARGQPAFVAGVKGYSSGGDLIRLLGIWGSRHPRGAVTGRRLVSGFDCSHADALH